MRRYELGSEWRKWDLHVHAPGTKLNDNYSGPDALDRFIDILETSDVSCFGITDYFSADLFFKVRTRYKEKFPSSAKVVFPNIEVRLDQAVNRDSQDVHLHLILRPDVDQQTTAHLLRELKTQQTGATGRPKSCGDLTSKTDFEGACVSRDSVEEALKATFGKPTAQADNVILIVPAGNDGIRGAGSQRKKSLADEIDKATDAVFGNPDNVDWYLNVNRLEADHLAAPKPVFAGSDAHSFEDLKSWLGKTVISPQVHKHVTWIKADPSFEGLLQTLVEPAERVRIQPGLPDMKDAFKVIRSISFTGTDEFPERIVFNANLTSVIGSRSSGKSALLAYLAHAIDPEYTLKQQAAVSRLSAERLGPAASKSWVDVSHIGVSVEWLEPSVAQGKIVYIPQNSLYSLSERPDEITARIKPVLFRIDPGLEVAHSAMLSRITESNEVIRSQTSSWFRITSAIDGVGEQLRLIGDRSAIHAAIEQVDSQIAALRVAANLTAEDTARYDDVVDRMQRLDTRRAEARDELTLLAPFTGPGGDGAVSADTVQVEARLIPALDLLPPTLRDRIGSVLSGHATAAAAEVRSLLVDQHSALVSDVAALTVAIEQLLEDEASLFERNRADAEIDDLAARRQRHIGQLSAIDAHMEECETLKARAEDAIEAIKSAMSERSEAICAFATELAASSPRHEDMTFGVEQRTSPTELDALTSRFNRSEKSPYSGRGEAHVRHDIMVGDVAAFLQAMRSGSQKVRIGESLQSLAADALALTPELRFYANLDDDRIGGWEESSMTPGKQALFALALILGEDAEAWPLLLDQPEDDLDSRSVYDVIVPYLKRRKRERQIIMATHDANLVVGADSEQVIVANRHGDDRPNRDGRTFTYHSGSLEHSMPNSDSEYVLETQGIREHACSILDGGEDAFAKRRDKYRI